MWIRLKMSKKTYIWSHEFGYWRDKSSTCEMGYKWVKNFGRYGWCQVWREPPADSALCWFPQSAGRLMMFPKSTG